jgi:solute:Na+ symporter, SSS family
MNPYSALFLVLGYFGILLGISWVTSRKTDNDTFFNANRKSPWFVVAFGMVGATLSGVTFISVPGEVGNSAFSYLQFVFGNVVGYGLVAKVLIPLYYRLELVSIYSFLEQRFGLRSYKTGSFFFLISKLIGASFRLYLVAGVLQIAIFDSFQIPFGITVLVSIVLIWIYTFRGGIKTIVWTDTLQTLFLIFAVIFTLLAITRSLGWNLKETIQAVEAHPYSDLFTWEWKSGNNFFKQFFAGMFITVVIVGMDQDMMQKNLTCKNRKDAQKNMVVFSMAFLGTVCLFLCLGVLLYIYASENGMAVPANTDDLYPLLAMNEFGSLVAVVFLLGITAAAYSSADSALAALTTSFCYDFLHIEKIPEIRKAKTRKRVHLLFSALLLLVILLFRAIHNESVVVAVFTMAGYTYGPILGLFVFGIYLKRKVNDRLVPYIAMLAPLLSWAISSHSEFLLNGYQFGFEILILNGFLTFSGLWAFSKKNDMKQGESVKKC